MTARERLRRTLFQSEGREHRNIKFCRGSAGDISPEDLCNAASLAIMQVDFGLVEIKEEFGDRNRTKVDVASL